MGTRCKKGKLVSEIAAFEAESWLEAHDIFIPMPADNSEHGCKAVEGRKTDVGNPSSAIGRATSDRCKVAGEVGWSGRLLLLIAAGTMGFAALVRRLDIF